MKTIITFSLIVLSILIIGSSINLVASANVLVYYYTDPSGIGSITANEGPGSPFFTFVNGAHDYLPGGALMTANPNPPAGWAFDHWEYNITSGTLNSSSTSLITYAQSNGYIKVFFVPVIQFSIPSGGSVLCNETSEYNGDNIRLGTVPVVYSITAVEPSGYVFDKWSVSGQAALADINQATTTFTVNGPCVISPTYIPLISTTMTVTVDKPLIHVGDNVTAQAEIAPNAASHYSIVGQNVVFSLNSSVIGYSAIDASGHAILTYNASTVYGTLPLRASFGGTDAFLPCNSSTTLTISRYETNVNMPQVALTQGQASTLTATLTDSNGSPLQGQTIDFLANSTLIGSSITNANGTASIAYTPKNSNLVYLQADFTGTVKYSQNSATVPSQISAPLLDTWTTWIFIAVAAIAVALVGIYVIIKRRH